MVTTRVQKRSFTAAAVPHAWSGASDEELLRAYSEGGDREAFAELVRRYERELYNYLRRYLGDAALADDAFQATFLQVHLKCRSFEAGRTVRPWLYTIATNQAIDAQRRTKRQRMVSLDRSQQDSSESDVRSLLDLVESREAHPQAELEANEHNAWLRRQVERLPEAWRIPLTMIYFQGLKYREAASALHLPVGTVKSRMNAALRRLNEAWNQQLGQHED